jgi:hypothetical protein
VCAADGQLRVVQPEGIAFGFDKGPCSSGRLQVVEVPIEPGDRLVLTNSAPVRIQSVGRRGARREGLLPRACASTAWPTRPCSCAP